ncbi:MAG TPA: hypothetical protein VGP82_11285 [Ktedonobacterales bacterium]|jgi:hypothetical protein|nr:hypothetical protein [Ktedonobacterales bacterium]
MPDNAQLQIGCQEGELVITPKWIRVQSPGPQRDWTVLRSAVVEVETTPSAEKPLRDITIRTRNGEWHAHKLAPEQAESVRDLLDCSPLAPPMTLTPELAPAASTAPAHELAPTVPPNQSPALPAAKMEAPSTELRVACQAGMLVITDQRVSLLGEHAREIPRSAVAGVTNQPRAGNRADLIVYSNAEGQLKPELLAPGVAPLDALHVIERLGYVGSAASTGEKQSRPTASGQPVTTPFPARVASSGPRPVAAPGPRVVSRRMQQERRRRHLGLAIVALAGLCLIGGVAGVAFNGINAPARAPTTPVAQVTVTHQRATTVPTRQSTPVPRATPTATLNTLEPVPLAFTCATAVSHSYGQVCVHTRPGAALTITVTYCSGFGFAENSKTLHGTSYADRNGDYTWNWVPQTDCRENATVYVTAESDGQRGYYVYDLSVR